MKILFKIFFWSAGSFLGALLLVGVAGIFLPREHQVRRRLLLKAPPEKVWALVSSHARDPIWRREVMGTTRLADRQGHPVWQDEFQNGQVVAYEDVDRQEGQKLVRRIVDQNAFGGTWTYDLRPQNGGTSLTLTEQGWVSLPFRVVARFVFGHATQVDKYLRDLARFCKESAQPEPA